MKKNLFILLTATLLFVFCFSFNAYSEEKKIALGLAIPYIGQEFWAVVQKGAEETAAKMPNVELTVVQSHQSPTKQLSQIEAFIAAKVNAILLPPADPSALVPAVEEANKQGIPVIGVDTAVVGGKLTSFIASNNITVGEIAGKYIADRLKGKGKIIVIGYPQHTATRQRVEGLKNVLKNFPDIQIIAEEVGKLPPDTQAQAENILTAYKQFDALFAVADVLTLPFWKVAKDLGRNKEIFFVGVDATGEALAAIEENSGYAASVAQQPYQMGALAVETAVKVVKGEKVESFTEVPVVLVTFDNLKDFKK
ncbi:MAG: sugar ABC transporter substrate-binding protein [Candidatus Atribacteria bacterium]|nr:sugar ABC transporter substrate-binding protein [Candidatus Atribacteria bacterium]